MELVKIWDLDWIRRKEFLAIMENFDWTMVENFSLREWEGVGRVGN